MVSNVYAHVYFLSGTEPNFTVVTEIAGGTTLSDDFDGLDNGLVADGDELFGSFSSTAARMTLIGLHNGGPDAVVSTGSNFYLYTDTALSIGNSVSTTNGVLALCFGAGSLIATPNGEQRVETMRIGDQIMTASGDVTTVKWVGHQTTYKMFAGPHMQPVRICAGALGGGLPHSDLNVTADHGMVLDGYVINASALVNGDTIDFVPMDELEDSFTVYHIETEAQDVILANGAASETFIDAAGRAAFDNHQEYLDLYGAERIIPEMDRPRISSRRLVPTSVKDRLRISTIRHEGPIAKAG